MFNLSYVFSLVCAVLLLSLQCATEPDEISGNYYGSLSPSCVAQYNRIFVDRTVPPRTYYYFHEIAVPDEPREEVEHDEVDFQYRIIGGNQVSITQVPYQVLYGLYCGGILIAPEWVLTAAHCKDQQKFVLAGSTQRSQTTKYPICAHFIHPLWNTTKLHSHDFDYQLVLLEKPIPVTPSSRPVAIGNMQDIRDGALVAVSGWGHTAYKQKAMQDVLRRVYVPVISNEVCKTLPLVNYQKITDRMFCAGMLGGSKDSCQGDSGGPAVLNGKLVGVVSFGVGCAMKDQPGVYSNVPKARGWIRSVTGLPL